MLNENTDSSQDFELIENCKQMVYKDEEKLKMCGFQNLQLLTFIVGLSLFNLFMHKTFDTKDMSSTLTKIIL